MDSQTFLPPELGKADQDDSRRGQQRKGRKTLIRKLHKLAENVADPDCQITLLLVLGGVTLFVALVVLPSLALGGFDRGWATARGEGFNLHIGWQRGCVKGFREISYNSTLGLSWILCEEGACHDECSKELVHEILVDSGSEWIGLLFPAVYVVAIVFPLLFCVLLPRLCRWGCEQAFGRSKRCDGVCIGHFCGLCLVLFVQAVWILLGVAVIVMSVFFVRDSSLDISRRSRAALNVVCDESGTVCENVKTLEECAGGCILTARGVVDCFDVHSSDDCHMELVHRDCEDPGAICHLTHSWAFYCAMVSGSVLIFASIVISRVLWATF
ncbi:hypothetical protein BSKO_12688 [Bryopsis sp. KO-2023]|nr:hypothetical protein BSKO_12688 [Bryopsis sp. KO-2023]